jgi:hypothetical protein
MREGGEKKKATTVISIDDGNTLARRKKAYLVKEAAHVHHLIEMLGEKEVKDREQAGSLIGRAGQSSSKNSTPFFSSLSLFMFVREARALI